MSSSQQEKAPSVALALGSGGARGLAHIGILKVLDEAGVCVTSVAGCSIGAVVGGLYSGRSLGQFEVMMRGLDWQSVLWFLDPTLPASGIFAGNRLEGLVRTIAGERSIESLPVRFCAIACDLDSGEEVRLEHGDLASAIRASFAIPGLFTPQRVDGRWLMDGGAASPVPVPAARTLGCERILAVDLHSGSFRAGTGGREPRELKAPKGPKGDGDATDLQELDLSSAPKLRRFLADAATRSSSAKQRIALRAVKFWSRFGERAAERAPSLATIIGDSMAIVQLHLARTQLSADPPDVLLEPELPHVGLFDFHRADEIIEEGERVARKALEAGELEVLLRSEPAGLGGKVKRWLSPGQQPGASA